ncbi:MAG: hypothetical protein M3Z57_01765 [Candidatus Dormibacteraeota bacterium]|nr:hypothetical protein [Candidatus Dormibacteraeota bacterium]
MSAPDDRDLAEAFDQLAAPPSTANYATRAPAVGIRTSPRRWPQVLATGLAVLVAAAGATTFLALRTARQGGAPASSTGTPPARSGAASAYDSTAGVTVMFGGVSGSGQPLTDTWTWDGSTWTSAARGPGALAGTRLVDDPADGGVLLLGVPVPPMSGSGAVGSGCSGGGTASPGSITGSSAGSAPASPDGNGSTSTGVPAIAPAPATGVPTPESTTSTPVAVCPSGAPPPAVQTWLFNSSSWHRAASGSVAATPPAGAQLAFDSTTRQVVAVSPPAFSCGPPLEGAVRSGAAIACPVMGSSSAAASGSAPCEVPLGCLPTQGLSTWVWSGGSWKRVVTSQTVPRYGVALVFADPATQHATLMTHVGPEVYGGVRYPQSCAPAQPCSAVPAQLTITTSTWTGSGWKERSQLPTPQQSPSLAGATTAAVEGHLVVLTTAGQTWTFAAGQWTQDTPSNQPNARSGAAMAEGPGGSVVLFGGAASSGVFVAVGGQSLGSDTWLWNGKTWQQRGGTAPSPPPSPTVFPCGPTGKTVTPPCVAPLPAEVSPATPVIPQASPPQAHGTPVAQATP